MAHKTSRGSPLLFIQYDKDGTFSVTPESRALLQSIRNKIAVIVLVGSYRTGKSYLMNRLQHNQKIQGDSIPTGFAVGNTVNACTKGIWISSEPYYDKESDTTYLFLDTEGLNSTTENQTHDPEIFTLGLLFSSVFMLNTSLNITEASLEQLELVIQASKTVAFNHESAVKKQALLDDDGLDQYEYNNDMDSQLAKNYPRLLWVVRDFTLQLVDKNNNPTTANQYLEDVLRDVPVRTKTAQLRNTVRKCVRDSFVRRDCITLVRPVTDERLLCKLDTIRPSELRPEFELGIYVLKNYLLGLKNHYGAAYHEKIRPQLASYAKEIQEYGQPDVVKKIDGKPITGDVLVGLAEIYCKAMTNREIPVIYSSWQSVVNTKMAECTGQMTIAFKAWLSQLLDDPEYASYYPPRDEEREPLTQEHLQVLALTREHLQQQQHKVHQKMSVLDLDSILQAQLTTIRQLLYSWFPDDEDKVEKIVSEICANSEARYTFIQRKLQDTARHFNKAMWARVESSPDDQGALPYERIEALVAHEEISSDAFVQITKIVNHMLSNLRARLRGDPALISEVSDEIARSLYERIIEACIEARHDVMDRAFKLQDVLLDTQDQLRDQVASNERLAEELAEVKGEHQASLASIKSLESNIAEHRSELHQLRVKQETAASENQQRELQYEKRLLAEQGKLQQSEAKLATVLNDLSRAKQDYKQLQADYASLKEEFQQYKQKQYGQQQSIADERREVEQKLSTTQHKYQLQQQQISEMDRQLNTLRSELAASQQLNNESNALQTKINRLSAELERTSKELAAAHKEKARLEQRLNETESKLAIAHTEASLHSQSNAELHTNLSTYESVIAELRHEIAQLRNELSLQKTQSEDMIRELQRRAPVAGVSGHRLSTGSAASSSFDTPSGLSSISSRGRDSSPYSHHVDEDYPVDVDDDLDRQPPHIESSRTPKRSLRPSLGSKQGGVPKRQRPSPQSVSSQLTHHYDDSDHEDENDEGDDIYDSSALSSHQKPTSTSTGRDGWEFPFSASPVKQPDQEKLLAKRRARGSILDDPVSTTTPSSGRRLSMGMRKHARVIDPAFKKAALDSWNDDYGYDDDNNNNNNDKNNAFQSMKPSTKPSRRATSTSLAAPAAAASTPVKGKSSRKTLPLDAEPVRDPTKLTVPQLKSWVTSLDIPLNMGTKYRRDDYIRLLYEHDPRL